MDPRRAQAPIRPGRPVTRRKGHSRDGLFRWLADGEVAVDEITANPLLVDCPACGAAPRARCTKPSRRGGGRIDVDPHPSRIDATGHAVDQPQPPETPPSAATSDPKGPPR